MIRFLALLHLLAAAEEEVENQTAMLVVRAVVALVQEFMVLRLVAVKAVPALGTRLLHPLLKVIMVAGQEQLGQPAAAAVRRL